MNRKGVAFLLALFTLIVVSLLTVAFLEFITTDLQITGNHQARAQAYYIAEAGVESAVFSLQGNPNWAGGGTVNLLLPDGKVAHYNVVCSGLLPNRLIRSRGAMGSGGGLEVIIEAAISITTGNGPDSLVKITSWREL